MSVRVKSAGTDGSWIAIVPRDPGMPMRVGTQTLSAKGAELRPLSVARDVLPAPRSRAAWPSYLALAGIVCAIDHGNAGAAALIAVWWFGWAVQR